MTKRQQKILVSTLVQGILLACLAYISQGAYWLYVAVAVSTYVFLFVPTSLVDRKKAKPVIRNELGESHFYAILFSMMLIFIYIMMRSY